GSPIRLEVMVNNRLDDPEVQGFVVVAREVGSRLAAEEQLRRSEERARALLQRASDMVLVVDRGGWITWASPSVTPALGYDADDLVGRNFAEVMAPDDRVAVTAMLAWDGPAPDPDESPLVVQLRHADGSLRTFALEASNLLDNPAVAGIVVTGTDVTERLDVQAATARVERHFRALVQESSDIVLLLDGDGRIRFTSPSVERVLRLAPDTTLGESIFDLVHPDDRPRAERAFADLCALSGPGEPVHLRFRSTGDGWRDLELLGNNLLADPDVGAVVMNGRDVTERRRAEDLLAQEAKLLERIASSGPTAELLRDLAGVLESHLPGVACSIGVLERDGVIRHPSSPSLPVSLTTLIDDVDPSSALGQSLRATDQLIVFPDVLADERWDGVGAEFAEQGLRACWVLPLLSRDTGGLLGTVTAFTAERRGPTAEERSLIGRMGHLAAIGIERGRFQAELEHRALHDALTGLPNRALLLDRLEHALARVRRAGSEVALLFVDLDQFKVVNDSLGHDAGDRLLMEVATRFRRSVRAGDTVARLGGDEFAVLCEDVSAESDAVAVAGHLHAALAPPFRVSGGELFVNCSIGIALASGGEPESVIRDADAAMYRAKDLGRNRHVVFEDALHDRMVRRLLLQRDVRAALAADEFTLRYQPRVRLSDGWITG
ncbi:MAG: diguanylate cyclase domain-containing protein, partial [Acidimicrobiales bacterium]